MSESKSAIPLGMAVYEHAAVLIGAGLWEASRSEELMSASHAKDK